MFGSGGNKKKQNKIKPPETAKVRKNFQAGEREKKNTTGKWIFFSSAVANKRQQPTFCYPKGD